MMEKRWWTIALVFLAVLSVISIVKITGFAVVGDFTTSTPSSTTVSAGADSDVNNVQDSAVQVQFPGSSQQGTTPISTGGSSSEDGSEVLTTSSVDEFHWVCSQNYCAMVEGPGENQCTNSKDCAVCGDGICQEGAEDEVSCLEDCPVIEESSSPDDSESEIEGEENSAQAASTNNNPALGQGSLSDEDYEEYVRNSFSTCTPDFNLCVRVPKVTGYEKDICGETRSCRDIKKMLDERVAEGYVQLSSSAKDVDFVKILLQRFFGFGS